MTRIKICGITNPEDAWAAVEAGADAIGFVFAPSPRQMTIAIAFAIRKHLRNSVVVVGVFVDEPVAEIVRTMTSCRLDFVQVHGNLTDAHWQEIGERLIPAITVNGTDIIDAIEQLPGRTVLLDAGHSNRTSATATPFDWRIARQAGRLRNIILAGGLHPDNVVAALETARPYAVDVSSGIETRPGVKDHDKLRTFIQRIRAWDSQTSAGISASSADDLFLKR
jgi:phosphoribosylanthranilate isomerase